MLNSEHEHLRAMYATFEIIGFIPLRSKTFHAVAKNRQRFALPHNPQTSPGPPAGSYHDRGEEIAIFERWSTARVAGDSGFWGPP
jgi:hypothetical protein